MFSGPKPNSIKGTRGVIKIQPSVQKTKDEEQKLWFANVLDMAENTVTLEVENSHQNSNFRLIDSFQGICPTQHTHWSVEYPGQKLFKK